MFDLYRYIGKVDYDGSWSIRPEHAKKQPQRGYGLQDLSKAIPRLVGQQFKIQVRQDLLKLHDEYPHEAQTSATTDAHARLREGKPIKILVYSESENNGHRVFFRPTFVEFDSQKPFSVDINTALTLLNVYPNNYIFELVDDDEAPSTLENTRPPKPKKRK